ncbi:hypothetical protein [Candidatus Electronema sp. JC]|uniref:hypothetical protein n=1 Tax=Candidatus Electronema sp. JC TaxID=3401570 RepID=UPI003B42A688
MAPSIDEFEDLTQFADESFDTGEVDLFEFADDDDSPLLRLKSIVLSLDWDITEEILTELNEELASLRAMWKDDKVAQIYLQGMENVGRYMQAEGAYAHPNAIKLLLTLYHNYEKIISSPNISGENITAMLKADIRKFKVLQYQISSLKNAQSGGREEPAAAEAEKPRSPAKPAAAAPPSSSAAAPAAQDSSVPGPLRSMEATILGLEWEVTDEGLEKFSKESAELRSHLSGDKEAQVLIQGLQALGAYIREQKTNAHPDSFTILHSFYDALKMLLESPQLGAEQRRHILLEQIGSLNSLKEVIARAAAGRHEAAEPEEPEPEPQEAPAADDAAFSFNDEDDAVPAADAPTRPAASAKPAASGDEDEEFGDDLFSSGGGVVPALADEEEEGGFSDSLSTADLGADRATELDEKLDSFFNFDDELDEASPPAAGSKSAAASAKSSLARVLDDTPEDEDDDSADLDSSFFNFEDEFDEAPAAAADKGSGAALNFADDDSDSLFGGETEEDASPAAQPAAELEPGQSLSAAEQGDEDEEDDELDSFFNFDDELDGPPPPAKAKAVSAAAPAAAAEDEDVSLFGDEEEDGPVAALADEKEIPSAAKEEDELGSDFDSFFSFDDEEAAAPLAAEAEEEPAAAEEPDEVLSMDVGLFGGEDDESPAAVPDEADEEIPAAEAEAEADMLDSGSLDSFFSFDDEEAAAPLAAEAEKEPDEVLSMDVGLFGSEDDESPAAASDEADEEIPAAEAEAEADMLDSGSLDSFFSFDDEEAAAPLAAEAEEEPAAAEEPDEVLSMDVGLFGGEDDESPAAASDEADEEIGSEKAAEIKSKLDSLFSFEDDSLNNDLVEDSQDDTPDLDDDLITPLDDEPSAKIADENLFGADEFNDSSSPAAEEEEPVADSLTADNDDALFGFDSGLDDGGGAAEAGEEPDFSAIGEDEDEAPAAEETEEAFFSIAGDEDSDSLSAAAEEEPEVQDEPFGLAEEESEAAEADSLTAADDDDALFGFDSGLDDGSGAAEAGEEPNFSAIGEDEDEAPAAEETEEAFFSIAGDEGSYGLSAAAEEEELEAQDELFGLAEEESEAAEADSLTADEDDALFSSDSGALVELAAGKTDEEADELTAAALPDDNEDDLLLGKEYEAESQSAFFGQDDLPDPFASGVEPEPAEDEEEAAAGLSGKGAVAGGAAFASLAAAAAALSAVPSSAQLRQVAELASTARREEPLSVPQSIIMNLLDSSAALLAQAPEGAAAGGGAVMQELAAALKRAEEPEALAGAVSCYTAWQQDFFAALLRRPQLPEEAAAEDSLGLVREEFSRLKQELLTEFSQLRKEMMTLRS